MSKTHYQLSQLRIIGGKWRSRKIKFYPAPELQLRPTPNRVRETLFNWLMPVIQGSRCLDSFAGSGALGFEALSRGAKSVVMIDQSAKITEILKENAAILKTENLEIYTGQFAMIMENNKFSPFDIVFLDPPFKQDLIKENAEILEQKNLLAENAYIYIEAEPELKPLPIPSNWEIVREKKAGKVKYYLVKRN